MDYFRSAVMANAGDTTGAGRHRRPKAAAPLRAALSDQGVLTTAAAECSLPHGACVRDKRVHFSTTAVGAETSTSDDLITWSDWVAVPADGKLASPNKEYIRFR